MRRFIGVALLGVAALVGWVATRPGPCERLQARLCAGRDCAARPEWSALSDGACRQGLDAVEAWSALPPALRGPTRAALLEGVLAGEEPEALLRRIGR